jgi:hypothetical protein
LCELLDERDSSRVATRFFDEAHGPELAQCRRTRLGSRHPRRHQLVDRFL